MRINFYHLQTLGKQINSIQKGGNAYHTENFGVDLHITPISQWLIRKELSIGSSGACMGGPHLDENQINLELFFDKTTGQYRETKSHSNSGSIPWISIEQTSSRLQKELCKSVKSLNQKIWSTIG
ncbi:MAG: hypothetical protein ACK481_09060, partial [Candidatus Melainabacteria bacterium]